MLVRKITGFVEYFPIASASVAPLYQHFAPGGICSKESLVDTKRVLGIYLPMEVPE